MPSLAEFLNDDMWGRVIELLSIRQQVQFRRVSPRMRDITNSNRTSYGKLLMRYGLMVDDNPEYPDPVRFFNTWVPNFRFKLKGDELDFFCAVINGDLELIKNILKQHPNYIFLCDNEGNTVLHYAAACSQADTFHYLTTLATSKSFSSRVNVVTRRYFKDYEHGILKTENTAGENAFDWIFRYGQVERFRRLLELKNKSYYVLELQKSATRYGRVDLLFDKGLLSDPVGIAQNNQEKNTLLHTAARHGQRVVLKRFVQGPHFSKADLRKQTKQGSNIFHLAVYSGNEQLVVELLDIDPTLIDSLDAKRRPALYYAVKSGRPSMVKRVHSLQPKAINLGNIDVWDAIESNLANIAIRNADLESLQYLLQNGTLIPCKFTSGLNLAVERYSKIKKQDTNTKDLQNSINMIVYLCNYFQQAVKENKYGKRDVESMYDFALKDAIEKELDELLPILIAAGAKPWYCSKYKYTSESEKQKLPKIKRQIIDDYQKHDKEHSITWTWILSIGVGILLYMALMFGIICAFAYMPILLCSWFTMSTTLQLVTFVIANVLSLISPIAYLWFTWRPFINIFLGEVDGENKRVLSPVTDVAPLYDVEQAKRYYLQSKTSNIEVEQPTEDPKESISVVKAVKNVKESVLFKDPITVEPITEDLLKESPMPH